MKKIIVVLGSIVLSVPVIITILFFDYKLDNIITGFIKNEVKKEEDKLYIRVLKSDKTVENIELEEYIIGVVSSEVPVSFEPEALKAQAVASRTYALKQMENNKDNYYDVTDNVLSQVYSSNDRLKDRWKDNYDEYYNKIKSIVEDTKGEYISYNDDFIYAFFFSTSNGYTEDNVNVFGQDLPYLKMVDSSFDESETDSFYSYTEYTKEEFYKLLGLDYSEQLSIDNIVRSPSNRVISIDINGITFKGRDFQKQLSLKSNDFTVEDDGLIKITNKGYGHGVGMSQYGANALAKQSKNYKEILEYYYQGTEIKKL